MCLSAPMEQQNRAPLWEEDPMSQESVKAAMVSAIGRIKKDPGTTRMVFRAVNNHVLGRETAQ